MSKSKRFQPHASAAQSYEPLHTQEDEQDLEDDEVSSDDLAEDLELGSVRVIKKYPNRRLYDTETSSYITLADVRQLVMDSETFVVRDAKTHEDLTRSILLQIILEEEAGVAPMFTQTVLAQIIRFYGHTMQGFMGSYLEKNMQGFIDLQRKMAEQAKGLSPEMWTQVVSAQSPVMQGMMSTYVEQSKKVFTQMQEQMQKQNETLLAAFGLKR